MPGRGWRPRVRPDEARGLASAEVGRTGGRDRFGPPDTVEEHGDMVSAFWRRGSREVSFTGVGTSSGVTLSRRG